MGSERCMVLPHRISTAIAWGRRKAAIVAVAWTFARSWSALQGAVTQRDRGLRQAAGTLTSIGACPVVACCVTSETTKQRPSARVALRIAWPPPRVR